MPLVLYFFQGETGESLASPNAFRVPDSAAAPTGLTFGAFLQHFPPSANTNGGRLHFRFRVEDAKLGYIWRDVQSPQEILPVYRDNITAKVLCLDPKATFARTVRLRRRSDVDFGAEGLLAARTSSSSSSSSRGSGLSNYASSHNSNISRGSHQSYSGSPYSDSVDRYAGAESKGGPSHFDGPAAEDFVDFMDADLSGHNAGASASSSRLHGLSDDLSGIDIEPPQPPPSPVKLNREELVARREAGIQEKVNQALEFKQELDENLKRESDELEAAKLKHDGTLTEWAFDQSKKKRNVRTLLTTMHKVLWSDSSWKPIGLGDVIEPKKVKLQFRKAMLVVHPDRCTALTAENRFVGKRVFEAINEAYQEFLKTESVD